MSWPRADPAAIRLLDGGALIVGGTTDSTLPHGWAIAAAEVDRRPDVRHERFHRRRQGEAWASATASDGRVLVAGGTGTVEMIKEGA